MTNTKPLLAVRRQLGKVPIVEGEVGGPIPLFVERYMYQAKDVSAKGHPYICLVNMFGGNPVKEGDSDQLRHTVLPTESVLIPPNTPTHWSYTGTVDYALFFILDTQHPVATALLMLTEARRESMSFTDPLVGAASRQLLDEIQKGDGASAEFMESLASVIFTQTYQSLTTPAAGSINPRHGQFSRIQSTLNFIRANLSDDLSVGNLAKVAGIDVSYFRRIFQDATGMAPHDYVLSVRLEATRKLLIQSSYPISQIASVCGFASQSHLTARFREAHSVTPAQFRKRIKASV